MSRSTGSVLLVVENNSVPFDRRVWREGLTLKKAGFNVKIISPSSPEDPKEKESVEGINIYRYKPKFSSGSFMSYIGEYLWAFFCTFFIALKIRLREKIDIIHSANPPDIFWALAIFFKIFGAKYIFDEHDLSPELYLSRYKKNNKGVPYRILLTLEKLSYKTANVIISTNQSYREIAAKRDKRSCEKIFIVRNGPDSSFRAGKKNNAWKRGREYLIAYLGTMAIQDGVDHLLLACHHLVNKLKRNNFQFVLIGAGDELENLKKLAKKLRIDEYVTFIGRAPDKQVIEILSTADIAVDCDPYNPLNNLSTMNKIMEYMACRCPIVSYNLKEAKYSAQEAALYVKNNSPAALAEGILKLAHNSELAKKMADFGYKRATRELSWERQEKKLLEAYRHLVK